MSNFLIFLGGAGFGVVLMTIIALVSLSHFAAKVRSDKLVRATERVEQQNEETLKALIERNEIGREQVKALRALVLKPSDPKS